MFSLFLINAQRFQHAKVTKTAKYSRSSRQCIRSLLYMLLYMLLLLVVVVVEVVVVWFGLVGFVFGFVECLCVCGVGGGGGEWVGRGVLNKCIDDRSACLQSSRCALCTRPNEGRNSSVPPPPHIPYIHPPPPPPLPHLVVFMWSVLLLA